MFKRFMLALALIILFMTLWTQLGKYLGYNRITPPQSEEVVDGETREPEPIEQGSVVESQTTEEALEPQTEEDLAVVIEPQTITLSNEQLILQLDNKGGVITQVQLVQFFESGARQEQVRLVNPLKHFPGEVFLDEESTLGKMFEVVEHQPGKRVVFRGKHKDSVITKTFTLGEAFLLDLQVDVTRQGQPKPFKMVLAEGLQAVKPGEKLTPSFLDFGSINPKIMSYAWSVGGDEDTKGVKKQDRTRFLPLEVDPGKLDWAGIKDNYFANVFLPVSETSVPLAKITDLHFPGAEKPLALPVMALESNTSLEGSFYLGPMLQDQLVAASPSLENLLSYGWAGLLSKWLFIGLDFCHSLTGNWGWAIIILTFFIRLLMVPLTIPSIKSSFKMKKIQPKITKIREKYSGKDMETKQKLSQETFKLYKEEGVNPFSSCFTALAQMPVFFAYFSLLRSSIYLRQADWMFWINDLSIKDPTYILPILMGATMFLSTMAMPMPGADPAQQKMMKFMPVMFSLMFIGMPAGLILYMITSNLFSMGQTKFMKWRYEQV